MSKYNTKELNGVWSCDCQYFIHRKQPCKHIVSMRDGKEIEQINNSKPKKINDMTCENFQAL